ncbi:hypothetical protein [Aeoliella sp.]|uniref:hypothetical protein n=1 Tax=Aeoliella sp. TaxID=2795800 RepID=UPI003CCB763B
MRAELISESVRHFPVSAKVPRNRLVRLSSGEPVLAGATDEDVIGAGQGWNTSAPYGRVAMRSASSSYLVEASGEVTEGVVYQAANGMVASSGTVVAGVALEGGTDEPVQVMPL